VPDGKTPLAPRRAEGAARLRVADRGAKARALAARVKRPPLPLAILLVFALVQGLAWSVMTTPFNGPDEPAHIAYVQLLAETGHAPKSNGGTGSVSTELGRAEYQLNIAPNFGHTNGRPTWSALDRVAEEHISAAQRRDGTGPNAIAQNPPLYYAYEALAYRLSPDQSLLGRVFALRAATVVLYVLTVGLMWLVAGEIFTRPWLRFLATAIVALHPKLASLAGNVNPDNLLVTISTGFVLAGLRLLRRGPSTGRVGAVALLAGLGALTHGRGLFLIVPAVIVVGTSWLRARPSRMAVLRQAVLGSGLLLACIVVAYVWTRSTSGGVAFGGQVDQAATEPWRLGQFVDYVWQFYLPRLPFMGPMIGPPYGYRQVFIETFFGGFANYEVNFRPAAYDRLQDLAFLGLLALVGLMVVRYRAVRARWPEVVFPISVMAGLLAVLHITAYRHLQQVGDPLITGRYLLPCIALFGLAIAWVVGSLRRIAPWVGALVLAGFVLLDIEAFLINAQRFYA
jgi:4-amino-4-deoxy-L-arabinose transferase-like glycosyltransferase